MKVNYNGKKEVTIKDIPIGEAFFANRKSVKGKGIYMRIDGHSGLIKQQYNMYYAVNLETGQLRNFREDILVEKVLAEIFFPKG